MEDIIILGFGGHAKSVADSIERQGQYRIIGYTDIKEYEASYKYLGNDDVLVDYFAKGIRNVFICVGYLGNSDIREKLYEKVKNIGFCLPVIIDPSAIISSDVTIGEGSFIGKCAIVNSEAKIGKMTIINTKALIEHECIVDNFVHIAVAAVLCGSVKVGESAFIGANSTIIQGRKIDSYKIIPAGVTIR